MIDAILQRRYTLKLQHALLGGMHRAARRLGRPGPPGVPILLYHRVAELPVDPWLLAVTPHHFAAHMRVLAHRYRPMSLGQLVAVLRRGEPLPQRSVVVAFDDGYADNLHHALPVLAQHGVPATIFLASGMLGVAHEFWWDALERLLLQPGTLPAVLQLKIDDRSYTWNLGVGAHYSVAD